MGRKLIIDGNAVYEIDEECMLKNQLQEKDLRKEKGMEQNSNSEKNKRRE